MPNILQHSQWYIEVDSSNKTILNNTFDSGLYSSTLAAYFGVVEALKANINIDKIQFIDSHSAFKNIKSDDLYPILFELDKNLILSDKKFNTLYSSIIGNDLYKDLEYDLYNVITSKFFKPSPRVLHRKDDLMCKYNIDPSRTIGLLYRGTERFYENRNPEYYITLANKILQSDPDLSVFVQTDQQQFVDACYNAFIGRNIIVLDELPRSSSSMFSDTIQHIHDRTSWSVDLDAMMRIISQCEYLINHNGNVAFMACLYRGHANNMFMFNKHSELILPYNSSI
jgi:hypothetical protein